MISEQSRFVIVGAGGFGREVLMAYRAINESHPLRSQLAFAGFIDDDETLDAQLFSAINAKVVGGLAELRSSDSYVISVAKPHTRLAIQHRIAETSARPITLVHPTAWMGDAVEIGQGTIVTAHCSLTTNIRLGNHVHVNLGCTIGHDARLDNFVTLSPGVHISGNVHLGEGVLVGTGAVVLPGVTVGRGAVIGAGAVVTKDVPENQIAIGTPAKALKASEPFPQENGEYEAPLKPR